MVFYNQLVLIQMYSTVNSNLQKRWRLRYGAAGYWIERWTRKCEWRDISAGFRATQRQRARVRDQQKKSMVAEKILASANCHFAYLHWSRHHCWWQPLLKSFIEISLFYTSIHLYREPPICMEEECSRHRMHQTFTLEESNLGIVFYWTQPI